MSDKKVLKCFNCGTILADQRNWWQFQSCGEPECEEACKDAEREQQEMAQEAAMEDGFSRYY